jgi:hypothetical protein
MGGTTRGPQADRPGGLPGPSDFFQVGRDGDEYLGPGRRLLQPHRPPPRLGGQMRANDVGWPKVHAPAAGL